jgi:hypothetical protein
MATVNVERGGIIGSSESGIGVGSHTIAAQVWTRWPLKELPWGYIFMSNEGFGWEMWHTQEKKGTAGESFLILIGISSACRRRSRSKSVGEWSRDRGARQDVRRLALLV